MMDLKFGKDEIAWMDSLFFDQRIKVKIIRNESKIPESVTGPNGRPGIREVHAYTVQEVSGKRRWALVPETVLHEKP